MFKGRNSLKTKTREIHPKHQIKTVIIYKGDLVQVISGKDAGKQGQVLQVIPKRNLIVVENCNMATKHMKPNPFYPRGGKIKIETPFQYSNVQLVDTMTNLPTKVKLVKTRLTENESEPLKLHRLSESTKTFIPIPRQDKFKDQQEGPKDTPLDLAEKVSWKPNILQCPFPPEFMNELARMRRKNRESQAL